jgi:hypothetical protein
VGQRDSEREWYRESVKEIEGRCVREIIQRKSILEVGRCLIEER